MLQYGTRTQSEGFGTKNSIMPNYDYLCRSCGKKFEIHHKMNDEAPKSGPQCTAKNCSLEKQLSAPHAVIRSPNPLSVPASTQATERDGAGNSEKKGDTGSHSCTSGCSFHRH